MPRPRPRRPPLLRHRRHPRHRPRRDHRAAELLIGPSSDLLCLAIDGDEIALPDAADCVDELRRRERTLLPPLHDIIDALTAKPV
jgi:hypothetical protein